MVCIQTDSHYEIFMEKPDAIFGFSTFKFLDLTCMQTDDTDDTISILSIDQA